MESLLHGIGPVHGPRGFLPRADIHLTESGTRVTLDLAGVLREDIEIVVVEGEALRVAGVRREPEACAGLRWHQMEIAYGPFERVVALPQEIDPERITATYRDGFLRITIPRGAATRSVPIDSP